MAHWCISQSLWISGLLSVNKLFIRPTLNIFLRYFHILSFILYLKSMLIPMKRKKKYFTLMLCLLGFNYSIHYWFECFISIARVFWWGQLGLSQVIKSYRCTIFMKPSQKLVLGRVSETYLHKKKKNPELLKQK